MASAKPAIKRMYACVLIQIRQSAIFVAISNFSIIIHVLPLEMGKYVGMDIWWSHISGYKLNNMALVFHMA